MTRDEINEAAKCAFQVEAGAHSGVWIPCPKDAEVVVRQPRSAAAAKVIGRDHTDHKVCRSCASEVVGRNLARNWQIVGEVN